MRLTTSIPRQGTRPRYRRSLIWLMLRGQAMHPTIAQRFSAVGEFLPGYETIDWSGVCAPKNTPAAIIAKLNREINAVLVDPRVKARLADLGSTPMPLSPLTLASSSP